MAPPPLVTVVVPRAGTTIYGASVLDCHGRIGGPAVRALGWTPGTRVNVVVTRALITLRASAEGALTVTPQGHVRLPASARHVAGIEAGVCVVLAADPSSGLLRMYSPATLDALLPPDTDTDADSNPVEMSTP